jgi:hypothetical protein
LNLNLKIDLIFFYFQLIPIDKNNEQTTRPVRTIDHFLEAKYCHELSSMLYSFCSYVSAISFPTGRIGKLHLSPNSGSLV